MLKLFVLPLIFGVAWGSPISLTPQLSRIVGGNAVSIKNYPYQLALYTETRDYLYFCGAALIGPQWALTAAHCIHQEYDLVHVRAGSTFKYSGGQDIPVSRIIVHPSFGQGTAYQNDFALLKLANPVTTENAEPIPLPPANYQVKAGDLAVISGWGALANNGTTETLQAAKIPIVKHSYCSQKYGYKFTDAMFCAGRLSGGVDTCQGDSGGPVVVDGRLVGIVSWGYGCGAPLLPGVYADVAKVRGWIDGQISEFGGFFEAEGSDIDLDIGNSLDNDGNFNFEGIF